MKKLFVFLVVICFGLTGCGKEEPIEIACSLDKNDVKVIVEDNIATKLIYNETITVEEEDLEEGRTVGDFANDLLLENKELIEQVGVLGSMSTNGNDVVLSFEFDLAVIDEETVIEVIDVNEFLVDELDLETAITSFEERSLYVCKQ